MVRGGTELCGRNLANLGSSGSADGGCYRPDERAAGCAAEVCGHAGMGCELRLSLMLRGGGDVAEDDSAGQQSLDDTPAVEEDCQGATQAYDGSSDEEEAVGQVIRIDQRGR